MRKQEYPQLSELRGQLRDLQGEFRGLQQEWVETHRKLLNTLRSINRGGGKKAPETPVEVQPAVPSTMDPFTTAILKRRGIKWPTDQQANASE